MRFCQQAGLIPLPLRENTLCLFVAHLVEQGLQHSSIRLYLSSLRHLQISSGLPDPFTAGAFPRLHYVLRGVQRSVSPGSPTRLPITPHLLQLLLQVWTSRPMSYEVRLLWAACCVGFFGFLRVGEFTVRNSGSLSTDILSIQDVARDATNPPHLFASIYVAPRRTHSSMGCSYIWVLQDRGFAQSLHYYHS